MTLAEFLTEKLESGNKYNYLIIPVGPGFGRYRVMIEDHDYKYMDAIPEEISDTNIDNLFIIDRDEYAR